MDEKKKAIPIFGVEVLENYGRSICAKLPTLLDKAEVRKRTTTVNFINNFILQNQRNQGDGNLSSLYGFFIMLQCLVRSIKSVGDNPRNEIDSSRFVTAILNSLVTDGSNFKKGTKDNEIVRKKIKVLDDFIAFVDEQFRFFDKVLRNEFDLKYFNINDFEQHQEKSTLKNNPVLDAVQGLFDYCAKKEIEGSSHVEKREKVYEVLQLFFKASKSSDYIELFQKIAEGIKLSRKIGKDGENSRESEYALIKLRDALVHRLLINSLSKSYHNFDETQLQSLLRCISYRQDGKEEKNKYTDVSCHTMAVIDLLAEKNAASKQLNPRIIRNLRIEHIETLLFHIPQKINGVVVHKAQYCFDKGSDFPKTIMMLLSDPGLGEEKLKIAAFGFKWNQHILEALKDPKNGEKITQDYFVNVDNRILENEAFRRHPAHSEGSRNHFVEYHEKITKARASFCRREGLINLGPSSSSTGAVPTTTAATTAGLPSSKSNSPPTTTGVPLRTMANTEANTFTPIPNPIPNVFYPQIAPSEDNAWITQIYDILSEIEKMDLDTNEKETEKQTNPKLH